MSMILPAGARPRNGAAAYDRRLARSKTADRHNVSRSKRTLDIVGALLLLLATAPLILFAMLLVRLSSPGPALFRQTRIGKDGRPFTMLKLRTMRINTSDDAHRAFNMRLLSGEVPEVADGIFKLHHDDRVTPIGRWLRRLSIDELPQLWNVLKGDMSLVGPRPSLPWEVALYTAEQCRRHECLPGITGLWQVSGRSRCTMLEMLALDVTYVDRRSLRLDLWILIRTPKVVLFDKDAQ
jgi:lipopolysaccharide/colanic/teichoic acid biosynthesis glycosyltransferase